MTEIDKSINIWIIDDLDNRRKAHYEIFKNKFQLDKIHLIAHPSHLQHYLSCNFENIYKEQHLFFSDYNMNLNNVEWTDDLQYLEGLKASTSLDDFPGTQAVLREFGDKLDSYMLILISTLVEENPSLIFNNNKIIQTVEQSWEYENLPLKTFELGQIHKLGKPLSVEKVKNVFQHYNFLQKK
jgi:hypothetical protein